MAAFTPEELVPIPGAKSKVWQFFGFKVDEKGRATDKKQVICKICKSSLPYSGNTTNLLYHLRTVHKEQHQSICATSTSASSSTTDSQTTISSYIARSKPYSRNSARFQECELELLKLICKRMLPVSFVDCGELKSFIDKLDPCYKPSSRTHFSRVLIPTQYELVKQRIIKDLQGIDHCSFTCDLWTGCHNRAYISLTVHFINSSIEVKNYCLSTREVAEAHTAENLADVLQSSITEWDLIHKIFGFCTDNAKNIVNCVVDHLKVIHLPCIGHTLQLSVQKAFDIPDVASVIGRVKKLVAHFKRSTKCTYSLREKQRLLNLPQHELIQQCDTRWGSVYHMLERFLERQPALCAVLMSPEFRQNRIYLPEGRECTLIEELVLVLKPFVQATTLMSGSSYCTVGMVSPLLYKLQAYTTSIQDRDSATMKRVKKIISDDLNTRYQSESLQSFLKKCSFLDPRFKNLSPFVQSDEHCDIIEAVKIDMLQYVTDQPDKESTTLADTPNLDPIPSSSKKRKLAGSIFSDFQKPKSAPTSAHDLIASEIRRYIEEDLLDYDSDPLCWWKEHKHQYPVMVKLLRKLWSLPGTSVRSEELFSLAGNVLSKQRNRLLLENVDALLFLCNNM